MSTYLIEFSIIATAHLLALFSPGPDFFLITGTSIRNGIAGTAGICIGIAAGNGLYIVFALAGFTMIKENPLVFQVMKVAGASYLVYLGMMLLRASKSPLCNLDRAEKTETAKPLIAQFGTGFLSATLNPKNTLFYLSLYTLMVSKSTPLYIQSIYGIWMTLIVLAWDLLIAWAIGSVRVQRALNTWAHRIEHGSGLAMLLIGGGLLLN